MTKDFQSLTAVQVIGKLLEFLEGGYLVRDISHDDEPGWVFRQLPFVQTIARAKQLVDAPPASGGTERELAAPDGQGWWWARYGNNETEPWQAVEVWPRVGGEKSIARHRVAVTGSAARFYIEDFTAWRGPLLPPGSTPASLPDVQGEE